MLHCNQCQAMHAAHRFKKLSERQDGRIHLEECQKWLYFGRKCIHKVRKTILILTYRSVDGNLKLADSPQSHKDTKYHEVFCDKFAVDEDTDCG